MIQFEFSSGMESMAAWIVLNSPLPLPSTLIVRLIPNFSVNIGEVTFFSLSARAECEMQEMRNATVNDERRKEEHDEGRLAMS